MSNRMRRLDEAIDLGIDLASQGIADPHLHVASSIMLSLAGVVDQATWDEAIARARKASTHWPLTSLLAPAAREAS